MGEVVEKGGGGRVGEWWGCCGRRRVARVSGQGRNAGGSRGEGAGCWKGES